MQNSLNDDLYLGIDEKQLYELCLEIESCSDNLSTIFNELDDNMGQLDTYYKSSAANTIINSYNEFRKNYTTVKHNVNSYSEDLNALITNYNGGSKKIVLSIDEKSDDVRTQSKAVNEWRND